MLYLALPITLYNILSLDPSENWLNASHILLYLLSEMVWKMTLQETWMIWVSIFAWSWICGHGLDDALPAIDGFEREVPF